MTCPNATRCALFAQRAIQASLPIWRSYYCEVAFTRCERWRLASEGLHVPADLLPNGRTLELPLPLPPPHA